MSLPPGLRAELERLCSALVDGAIDDAEHARLEQLLRDDESCRRFYLEYVDLDYQLAHHPTLAAAVTGAPLEGAADSTLLAPVPRRTFAMRLRERWLPYTVTAALTLAASVVIQGWLAPPEVIEPALVDPAGLPATPVANVAPAELSTIPDYVATLSKSVDSRWAGDPLLLGMRLLPGVVELLSGTAELRFDGGAQLIVRGPAKLDIRSATAAKVDAGQVLFTSDDAAEPFALDTPWAQLVDYGTSYAVAVSSTGEEVHVFDGEVVRTPMPHGAADASRAQSVMAGHARRYRPTAACNGSDVPLDEARLSVAAFDRTPTLPRPADDPALLVYEPFACVGKSLPAADIGRCGRGFTTAWAKCCKSEAPIEFRLVDSLWRPQMTTATKGGGVSAECRGAMSRRIAKPLKMNENGVYYFTFLVRSERRSSADACDLQFSLRDHASHEPQGKLSITASWSNSKASLCWEGGGHCASLPMEPGKTYLLAGKIVAGRDAPDQAFLRLFAPRQPVSCEEPLSWTIASKPVLSDLTFDTVQLSANTTTPVVIDELRIGTSWLAVAGVYATNE